MNRIPALVTIALLSSILTPVVVSATGNSQTTPAAAQVRVETVAASTSGGTDAEVACARRVKVVYAGYGEGKGVPCAATAEIRR